MVLRSKTKIHKVRNIALRIAIVVLAYLFLYKQLVARKGWEVIANSFREILEQQSLLALIIATALLMGANWLTESLNLLNKQDHEKLLDQIAEIKQRVANLMDEGEV